MTGSISQGQGHGEAVLAAEVQAGLSADLPTLPTYCLYDDRGSESNDRSGLLSVEPR